jgi:hypothetical protein
VVVPKEEEHIDVFFDVLPPCSSFRRKIWYDDIDRPCRFVLSFDYTSCASASCALGKEEVALAKMHGCFARSVSP